MSSLGEPSPSTATSASHWDADSCQFRLTVDPARSYCFGKPRAKKKTKKRTPMTTPEPPRLRIEDEEE